MIIQVEHFWLINLTRNLIKFNNLQYLQFYSPSYLGQETAKETRRPVYHTP